MELATLTPLTTRTINRHALLAAGAGLIPVPVLDLAVISGIQFDLIRNSPPAMEQALIRRVAKPGSRL